MRRMIGTIAAALAIAAVGATGFASAGHGDPEAAGGKSFVGPVDDPFFVDLGSVFDGINIDKPGRPQTGTGSQGGGHDDVAGFNSASLTADLRNFGAVSAGPEPS